MLALGEVGIPAVSHFNAPYFDNSDPENRDNKQLTAALSYFLSTGSYGRHDLKLGVESYTSTRTGGNSQSSTGYVFDVDPVVSGGVIQFANGRLIPNIDDPTVRRQDHGDPSGSDAGVNPGAGPMGAPSRTDDPPPPNVDYENALLALMDDPGKATACLDALSDGTIDLACRQVEAGAHAVLISSAFAGAGFLSPDHYREFVLPHERKVIAGIRARHDVAIYTHTCGAIGDRLELMLETGTAGIDTLDPPPLGTVELAAAKARTAGKAFLKGNLDPVHTLLRGDRAAVRAAVHERIAQAGPGGGYVLSTACSVPPRTPPDNLLALREAATDYGAYPLRLE